MTQRCLTERIFTLSRYPQFCVFALGSTACASLPTKDPLRVVHGQELSSSSLPAIRLRVDSGFHFVGVVPFRIRDVAEGERFIFVDAPSNTVDRLVIAQFERILPTSEEIYRYSFDDALVVGGLRFRRNTFAFSHTSAIKENPAGEAALTVAFLAEHGYHIADEVMSVRYVTVPDDARKHELILFYIEPLEPAGTRLMELYSGDAETEIWRAIGTALVKRAEKAIAILPPDRNSPL